MKKEILDELINTAWKKGFKAGEEKAKEQVKETIKLLEEKGNKITKTKITLNKKEVKIIEKEMTYKETLKNIPKGYRLLKIQEVVDLVNFKQIDDLINKYKKDYYRLFIIEQMFDLNKDKVASLGSFDDGLDVDGSLWDDGNDGYAFGVFIEK